MKVEDSKSYDRNDIVTRTKSEIVMEMAFELIRDGKLTNDGKIRGRTETYYGKAFDDLLSEGVIERDENVYRFFHQTFFEYAAARAILYDYKNPEWNIEKRIDELLKGDHFDPLRLPVLEQIVLLANSFNNEKAKEQILTKLLTSDNLIFILEGLKILFRLESMPISTFSLIHKLWKEKEWLRHEIVEMAKSAPVSKALIGIFKTLITEDPGRIEFELIDLFGKFGTVFPEDALPILLDSLKNPVLIDGAAEALVEIGRVKPEIISDQIFETLFTLAKEGDEYQNINIGAIEAIGKLGCFKPDRALEKLLALIECGGAIRFSLYITAIAKIGRSFPKKVLPILMKLYKGNKITAVNSEIVTEYLCEIGMFDPDTILPILGDLIRGPHSKLRLTAARALPALARIRPRKALSLIKSLLNIEFMVLESDGELAVAPFHELRFRTWSQAVIALGEVGKVKPRVASRILKSLAKTYPFPCVLNTLVKLADVKPDEVLTVLGSLVKHPAPSVRGNVAINIVEIVKIKPKEAFALLLPLIEDENLPLGQGFVEELYNVFEYARDDVLHALEILAQRKYPEYDNEQLAVIEALGKIAEFRPDEVFPLLLTFSGFEHYITQISSTNALVRAGKLRPEMVWEKIPAWVVKPELHNRVVAILAEIGYFRPGEALALLEKIYKETEDPEIQIKAAKAIIKITR